MSDAISGVGVVFSRQDPDDSSGAAFVAVAEVNSIGGPTMSRDFIDVTSLDSTGGYREFIGGFRDGGEVTLEMNFTIGGYGMMKADFENAESANYRIVLPDTGATQFDFAGYVTQLPLNIVPDDKITASITIKVSGEVTLGS